MQIKNRKFFQALICSSDCKPYFKLWSEIYHESVMHITSPGVLWFKLLYTTCTDLMQYELKHYIVDLLRRLTQGRCIVLCPHGNAFKISKCSDAALLLISSILSLPSFIKNLPIYHLEIFSFKSKIAVNPNHVCTHLAYELLKVETHNSTIK